MVFDEFVDRYLPALHAIKSSPIHDMFELGNYSTLLNRSANLARSHDFTTMIVDAERFKTSPWIELLSIEKKIFPAANRFFIKRTVNNYLTTHHKSTLGRFQKRSDGHFCIRKELQLNTDENMICMPSTKGRSSFTVDTISNKTMNRLLDFYNQDDLLGA